MLNKHDYYLKSPPPSPPPDDNPQPHAIPSLSPLPGSSFLRALLEVRAKMRKKKVRRRVQWWLCAGRAGENYIYTSYNAVSVYILETSHSSTSSRSYNRLFLAPLFIEHRSDGVWLIMPGHCVRCATSSIRALGKPHNTCRNKGGLPPQMEMVGTAVH
jgi:hypothetical protein